MSGARNRKSGHGWEVLLANELSDALNLEIVTTRSLGANYGADLATVTSHDARGRPVTHVPAVLGWSIEAKAVKRRVPRAWLRQAHEQAAPGTVPVVLWKRPRKPWREGSAFTYDDDAPRGWREITIGKWLDKVEMFGDVTAWDQPHEALDELVRISEDAGLYDTSP